MKLKYRMRGLSKIFILTACFLNVGCDSGRPVKDYASNQGEVELRFDSSQNMLRSFRALGKSNDWAGLYNITSSQYKARRTWLRVSSVMQSKELKIYEISFDQVMEWEDGGYAIVNYIFERSSGRKLEQSRVLFFSKSYDKWQIDNLPLPDCSEIEWGPRPEFIEKGVYGHSG